MCSIAFSSQKTPPETELAELLRGDLRISVNAQELRLFIRARWDRVAKLAHAIHGKSP